MNIAIPSLEALPAVAQALLAAYPEERFYAFFGKMGVGKTTLIKALCAQLGVTQNVCSPTFAIINEYAAGNGDPIYHFDFYRLKSLAEAYDLGYEEYFYSGYYCFTEWTEKVEEILPTSYLRVTLTECDAHRTLQANLVGPRP